MYCTYSKLITGSRCCWRTWNGDCPDWQEHQVHQPRVPVAHLLVHIPVLKVSPRFTLCRAVRRILSALNLWRGVRLTQKKPQTTTFHACSLVVWRDVCRLLNESSLLLCNVVVRPFSLRQVVELPLLGSCQKRGRYGGGW